MMFGYGAQILHGTLMTLSLMALSLVLSTIAGIMGALCKTSGVKTLRWGATAYTTSIRSVPDLVLMLLIFYNIQILVNQVTTLLGLEHVDINAFAAGIVTLAFIYGAYMTETFRGAFESVPRGQVEAGISTGMSDWQVFHVITLPAMVRFALPSYSNNTLVVIKATALVSILGLVDIVSTTQTVGRASQHMFFFNMVAAAVYLALTCIVLAVVARIGKRFNVGVRKALL